MFEVRCEGCQAPFEVDEKRVPKNGMRMRCPKCGASFTVRRPEGTGSVAPPAPFPTSTRTTATQGSLPVPSDLAPGLPAPRESGGGAGLPAVRAGGPPPFRPPLPPNAAAQAPTAPPPPSPRDSGMLPVPADLAGSVGLPAPSRGGVGLPAPVPNAPVPPAPAASPEDLPSPLTAGLPAVAGAGLPAVAGAGLPAVAGAGLPAVAGAGLPAVAGAGLPAVAGAGLPAVAGVGLPSTTAMGVGLPAVSGVGLPASADATGLPAAAASLPVTAAGLPTSAAGLPVNAAGLPEGRSTQRMGSGFPPAGDDELDLPMVASDLPSVKVAPPPAPPLNPFAPPVAPPVAPPAPQTFPGFADLVAAEPDPGPREPGSTTGQRDIGASTLSGKDGMKLGRIGLERKAFTVSASDGDLPQLVGGGAALPVAVGTPRGGRAPRRDEMDFSSLSPAAPSPPAQARRTGSSGEFAPGAAVAEPSRPSGGGFGEIDLGGAMLGPSVGGAPIPPTPAPAPIPDYALPPSSGSPGRASDVGGEFDSIPGVKSGRTPMPQQPSQPVVKPRFGTPGFGDFRQAERLPPISQRFSGRQKVLYGVLGALAFVTVGGASLAVTPYGAFGKNLLDERINGPERHAAATRVIEAVDRSLERDTYDRAVAGLRRLDQAEARVPAEQELKAYIVYANNLVVARFGADPARTSRARTLLSQLGDIPEDTKYLSLARGSDMLARGNAAGALRAVRADPEGRDLATLAAEQVGDAAQTLRLARTARQRHPSPRARYLLARALSQAGDTVGARAEAEDLLRVEPRHVGGRILLARLLDDTEAGRVRALALMSDIVDGADHPAPAPGHTGRAAPTVPAVTVAQVASLGERAEANVVAGQAELARDHVTAAQVRFTRALELDPRSAPALVGLGNIQFRQGNFTDALGRFRNAFSAEHNNLDAAIGIAQSCLALNQPADARSAIEPVVHDHASDPRLHYWYGKALAGGVERTTAEREYREAIRLQPSNLDSYVALSELLIQMNRAPDADRLLNDARAHVPDGAAIHRALAHGRYATGDLAGAEAELRIALQREPTDLRAHFSLGEVYRQMQRLDQAEREFGIVAQADADYPGLALARGQLDEARGQLPQALNTFREALARDPTNVELIIRVASTLVALGNFGEADQMLRSVVVDHPTNAEAQYILGRARLGEDNFTDAVRYLDRAIELNPQRADFKAFGAEAHRQTGDITGALRLAQQSIELDPNFPRGYWVRAEITVHHGGAVEALADVRHATQLDPRFWPAYATWGDVDEALGHPRDAVVLYRMATEHDPRHGDWYFTLGRLYSDAGDDGQARGAFQHAIDLGATLTTKPTWYVQSLRLLADAERDRSPVEARAHYTEWLRLVPSTTAGYGEIQSMVMELGNR